MIKKRYLILFIVFAVIATGSFTTVMVLDLTNAVKDNVLLTIISVILIALAFAVSSFFLSRYITQNFIDKNLEKENEYNLGIKFNFYNLDAFIRRVNLVNKYSLKFRKKEQYVVAFTASNKALVKNNQRNDDVVNLNGKVALNLADIFLLSEKGYSKNRHVYCFDKGLFYIYSYGDDESVIRKLLEDIKNNIYKSATESGFKVAIEPLFGVCQVKPGTLVGENIDNAVIARNISEEKFEQVTFYNETFRKTANRDDVKEIIEGLKNQEFVVYYQPKYNLTTKQFTSSEALVRWNSSKHGLLPPSKFIGTAEAAGLIHEIDTFVFKKVCEDLNETKRRGRRLLPVSVNFSLYEFFSLTFLDVILNLLDYYKVDPHLIQIEITETTSQANQFLSISIIKKLKEKGISILMDDFGVGFSNIGNFRKIPFDVIKIDKSFIDNIENDPKSAEIVKCVINLCKINDMEVVAEGVDNIKQVEVLKKFKCDTIQGFYYSKPLPKAQYDKFLMDNPFEARKEGNRK